MSKILKNKKILNKNKRYRYLDKWLKDNYKKIVNKNIDKYLEKEREKEGITNKIYFEEGFKEGIKFIKYFL